jgi:type I restriction enzyme, S subunit
LNLNEIILGSKCTVKSSTRIFRNEYVDSGIPFYRSKEIIDKALGSFSGDELFISTARFNDIKEKYGCPSKGDLLISSVGNRSGIPYVIQDEGDFYFKDGNLIWFSEFDDINSDFLCQWFKSEIGQNTLNSIMIGSAQKALTIDSLRKLRVQFPSIAYQDASASILKNFDHKIHLNHQINQTLESIAQTIFKSWFVDFDPVKAKMAGREPEGMDTETASLFPDKLVESELGMIPEGWSVSTIENEVDVYGGSTPSTKNASYWDEGEFNWATPKDLSGLQDHILTTTTRRVTATGVDKITSGQLPAGVLLMSSRAPVGYLAISAIPISINQGFIAMVCEKQLQNVYVLQWLKSTMDIVKSHAGGTTFAEISKKNFRPLPIIVPKAEVVKLFHSIVEPMYANITSNIKQNESLSEIRDTILPKLISGEIQIPGAYDGATI